MTQNENICLHRTCTKREGNFKFCFHCGTLVIMKGDSKIYAMKPQDCMINHDINPLQQFQAIENGINKQNFFIENKINEKTFEYYKTIRKDLFYYLQKLVKKYKYSDKVLYLGYIYLDTIFKLLKGSLSDISEYKLDLIVISCFLLAGK